MAYGNWGGRVYRNGKHMPNHEDQTPYREKELKSGYEQAFSKEEGCNPHHAVLGEKRVRLCGYKDYPVIYLDGEVYPKTGPTLRFEEERLYELKIEGYKFKITPEENKINLELIEPDGTKWTGFSGYMIGSGHEED